MAGFDPTAVVFDSNNEACFKSRSGLTDSEGSELIETAFAALCNAINSGKLKAMMRRNAHISGWDEWPNTGEGRRGLYEDDGDAKEVVYIPTVIYCESPDWGKTTIDRADLIAWLETRGVRSGFFFPTATDAPDYLDPSIRAMPPSWPLRFEHGRKWARRTARPRNRLLGNGYAKTRLYSG